MFTVVEVANLLENSPFYKKNQKYSYILFCSGHWDVRVHRVNRTLYKDIIIW